MKVEASAERLRSEASLRPSLAVPSAPEIISFSPVDHYGWSASFPVPVQEEGNFSLPHHDLSRRAYEVWRQQILR
ncbi:hypothetical protein EON64_04695 [archaeon]|nr:MAG: hypothetical protein EON64_04695 [archaeon]